MKFILRKLSFWSLFVPIFCFCGCSQQNDSYSGKTEMSESMASIEAESMPPVSNYQTPKSKLEEVPITAASRKESKADQPNFARMMIYTAHLRMQVKDIPKTAELVRELTQKVNGYISNESYHRSGYEESNQLTLRIPQLAFTETLQNIEALATFIEKRDIQGTDVTQEFYDIQTRIESKKTAEEQYAAIMKRAGSIKEVLEVQQHLRVIREEIETLQGRMKYLQNQTSYSTLHLTLYIPILEADTAPENSFLRKLLQAISAGWSGFTSVLLAITAIWPLLIVTGGVLFGWFKFRKRKK